MKRPSKSQNDKFKQIFNTGVLNYWHITGFDLIKFDDDFTKTSGFSIEETIRDKYGEEAVTLVKELIGINPFSF